MRDGKTHLDLDMIGMGSNQRNQSFQPLPPRHRLRLSPAGKKRNRLTHR